MREIYLPVAWVGDDQHNEDKSLIRLPEINNPNRTLNANQVVEAINNTTEPYPLYLRFPDDPKFLVGDTFRDAVAIINAHSFYNKFAIVKLQVPEDTVTQPQEHKDYISGTYHSHQWNKTPVTVESIQSVRALVNEYRNTSRGDAFSSFKHAKSGYEFKPAEGNPSVLTEVKVEMEQALEPNNVDASGFDHRLFMQIYRERIKEREQLPSSLQP